MGVVIASFVKVFVVVNLLMVAVMAMTWVERRGSAFIQRRLGPNRVGPFGLLQPVADGIKFLFKEDIVSPMTHRPTYIAAPAIALAAALCGFAVIPFGSALQVGGLRVPLVIADIEVGVLFLLAASSLGVYGIIVGGWASNNKYSQLGGLRSSSQMISYELALGLAVIAVVIVSRSLRPVEIVRLQAEGWWNLVYMPLGFLVLVVAGFAETNRLPFDLPEAESELVAGYHTEYSSMKFSMFFMAEYIAMVTISGLITTLYLGGYSVPAFVRVPLGLQGNLLAVAEMLVFLVKVAVLLWLFVWVRWTLPRFRFDQLLRLGWKMLIPLGFVNVIWAAFLVYMEWV